MPSEEKTFSPKEMRSKRPGLGTRAQRREEMVRVDHAGEYGAVRIYKGQLAVLKRRAANPKTVQMVEHMADQEQVHLERFNKILNDEKVRPTALTPIWHVAGFALGATSALLGDKAAMACTAAVEEVIDEHYAAQSEDLGEEEPDLKETIETFRAEEVEHKNLALEHGAQEAPGYKFLSGAIKAGTRLAIKLSEKI